jgi:3-oxoadipate enol-lactonase
MTLHHRIEGADTAPALVLSNSLGTTLEMWDPQADALASRFHLVRYDARGHGGSPVPPGPHSIDDLGTDVVRLLDRLGVERAFFCGLSLGGMVGMWLAANAPARIVRLVLCCTAPYLGRETYDERAATVREHGMEPVADAVLARWFTPEFHAARPDVVARFRAMLTATPPEGYAACCEAIAALDLRPRLVSISAPTLVVSGEVDPVAPPSSGESLAEGIRDARHVVVANAAHLGNVEQPDAFRRAILDHLTGSEEAAA